jgi:hypothetical protein
MGKAKPKAVVMVADGAGGMVHVQDRRFVAAGWPISFEVPAEQADNWLTYLSAEGGNRGWSSGGISQIEAKENSGTLIFNDRAGQPQMEVVWERDRGGPIKVRARPVGAPPFPLDQANEFIEQVNARSAAGETKQVFQTWHLCYEGLPWRGELWLDETLRLGPPSRQDKRGLHGPRIIIVSQQVNAIDISHAQIRFKDNLRELSVFLSVVLGKAVRVSSNGHRGWTWAPNPNGPPECDVRNLEYWETELPGEMPPKGQVSPVPLVATARADFSFRGPDGSQTELHLPAEVVDLWRAFQGLPPDLRRQYLEVGSMWQLAVSLTHEYETARFAFMVAACEALKPRADVYRDHNIYQVVEALLGKPIADRLQQRTLRPQDVRSAFLHSGKLHGSEFLQRAMMSSYQDPTFDQTQRELWEITQAAIIEWLRRSGTFTMPVKARKTSLRRCLKDHFLTVLVVIACGCLVAGLAMGWVLRVLWYG